jgi:hypothetical protein
VTSATIRRLLRSGHSAVAAGTATDALAPRWHGQPGRLEVWYMTLSDPATGIGCWVHYEVVAPVSGAPFARGWIAVFFPEKPPVMERFGPDPVAVPSANAFPRGGGPSFEPPAFHGRAGHLVWDLRWEDGGDAPLFTFPSWAWEREVLPGAQVVPVPSSRFYGTIRVDGTEFVLGDQARGAVAHIYGHGSAERWGWLHADLGEGDVLEIVSAVSHRPGLSRLPPMAFVQLRRGGRDWPRDPLVAAALFRTRLGLPAWGVRGTVGRWRLRADVSIPATGSVVVGYVDPDGSTATCTNSEVADAEVVLEHRHKRWEVAATWHLRGTAHAEIGARP